MALGLFFIESTEVREFGIQEDDRARILVKVYRDFGKLERIRREGEVRRYRAHRNVHKGAILL